MTRSYLSRLQFPAAVSKKPLVTTMPTAERDAVMGFTREELERAAEDIDAGDEEETVDETH